MRIVVDAMEHKKFNKGDTVIKQGEDGEDFYVLESGECHCFLNQPGTRNMPLTCHSVSLIKMMVWYNR
jgi:CRP-like cAMP-binding protein